MFTSIKVTNDSRKKLADCNLGMSYHERLVKSGAIDLKDNHKIQTLNNGYSKIIPLDTNKRIK
jgi:hypothetical protein